MSGKIFIFSHLGEVMLKEKFQKLKIRFSQQLDDWSP